MIIFATLCFIVPSVVWIIFILAFQLRSKRAAGTIVGYHGREGSRQAPIVEFQLPDGRKVTFTEPTHSTESIFDNISDLFNQFVLKKDLNQVTVLYDPNNPEKARVNSFIYLYIMPALLFVIGFCMVLYAIPVFHDMLQPVFEFLERFSKSL
jgi:hypothetical protein